MATPKKSKDCDLSTGQVAKYCSVAARTVCNWLDKGLLRGYRLPTGGHRRVRRDVLVTFMHLYQLPVPTALVPKEEPNAQGEAGARP